jgi:hypothetical protein
MDRRKRCLNEDDKIIDDKKVEGRKMLQSVINKDLITRVFLKGKC